MALFKKDTSDNKVDFKSLNEILLTSKNIVKILYVVMIVILILLAINIVKQLSMIKIIKDFLIIISPIFIGIILAWLLDPIAKRFEKLHIPRVLSSIITIIIFLLLIIIFFYLFIPNFISQIKDFALLMPEAIKDIIKVFENVVDNISKNTGFNLSSVKQDIIDRLTTFGLDVSTDLPTYIVNVSKYIINGAVKVFIGFMIGFYMLFDFDKINKGITKLIPKKFKSNYQELIMRINTSLRGYVSGVFIVMILVFLTSTIGFTIVGLPSPLIFAFFCAVTDIIPYFGPYIGAVPAVIAAFAIHPITGIFCVISILIVQVLENNFYQPLIMGHTMKLHPVTIMVGLLIFGHFFGIIGMIIATPVIASLKIIITFVNEKTKFFDKIINS